MSTFRYEILSSLLFDITVCIQYNETYDNIVINGKYQRGKLEWNNKYFVHFRFSQPAQKRQFGGFNTRLFYGI